jgi:uncharacterized membrane protein YbhN (UPF0104 family)
VSAEDGSLSNPLDRFTSGGWLMSALRIAAGAALVAAVLWIAGPSSLRHLEDPSLLPLIGAGAAIHLMQRSFRVRKWQLMIAPSSLHQRSFRYLMRIQFIGMLANLALPVSDALKVWAVSRAKRDVAFGAKTILVEMSLHSCAIGVAGAIAAAAARWWDGALWGAVGVMIVGPLAVVVVARRVRRPAGEYRDTAPQVLLFNVLETTCQLAIYAIAFSALGSDVDTVRVLALAPVLYLVDLANFTPSGLGLREALFAAVLSVLPNGDAQTGVAIGLLISSMLLLATLIGGAVALAIPQRE